MSGGGGAGLGAFSADWAYLEELQGDAFLQSAFQDEEESISGAAGKTL